MIVALAILVPLMDPDGRAMHLPSGRRRLAGHRYTFTDASEADAICGALELGDDLILLRSAQATTIEVDLEPLREADIDATSGAINGRCLDRSICDRIDKIRGEAVRLGARAFLEVA
jgi:hypothetical protein